MMCRFLSADFELSLRCPVDRCKHQVRFQSYPQLREHTFDVVACDAVAGNVRFTCGKNCRALIESAHYWQRIYPESVLYAQVQ